MKTLQVNEKGALRQAAAALLAGDVIIVPTDTVYGLAALPDNADAVQKIYRAKGRPDQLPLPVLAASVEQVRHLGVSFTRAAEVLADRWWPGPLTMAFGFSPTSGRPSWLAERDEVAVRIPQDDFLLSLLMTTGPLVVTSANRHGSATPTSAGQAGAELESHVSLVVDGGSLTTVPSTLVNVRAGVTVVERTGAIADEDIFAILDNAQ